MTTKIKKHKARAIYAKRNIFRALKFSELEYFRGLKLSELENFRALKYFNLAKGTILRAKANLSGGEPGLAHYLSLDRGI